MPAGKDHTNFLGMRLVRIEPGSFTMGVGETPLPDEVIGKPHRSQGDFDERPMHEVTICKPFYIGVHEVTNAQYEQFDPEHRELRGKLGFSREDDEAVVFVSWHDAAGFCEWLSEREGLPYRLPTEAEWEYACRAGTTTHFHTGDTLPDAFHKNARETWFPDPQRGRDGGDVVPLTVGQTPPNAWGLYDMHGNVEEWCNDWYGPYEADDQRDPVGRADGDFRVTRGGSHGTEIYYLRSANRMGTLPGDKSWMIGFRVVLARMPKTKPLPRPRPQPYQRKVKQRSRRAVAKGPDPTRP
ncbi:MAG: formylglycine-generating enzyme family protein, partial [Armatimonadota bacterium]